MSHNSGCSSGICVRPVVMATLGWLLIFGTAASAQKLDNFDRDRGSTMLRVVKDEIKKSYYDPAFHGINIDERFKAADEKIKTATSLGQVFGIIAQAVLDLDDSHSFFIPPQRASRTNYGWQMQTIGDKCYVTAVKPGSDADAKGLKPGDQLLIINGYQPTRDNLWKMQYLFNVLRPQPGLQVTVLSPGGNNPHQLDVLARVIQGKKVIDISQPGSLDFMDLVRESENEDRLNRHRFYEMGDDLFIWKMPHFDLNENEVDDMVNKIKKRKGLILDLRGNPGGRVDTLQWLLAHFVDGSVKLADEKGRKETKPLMIKARNNPYKGKVVILIDSRSASAAELFARMAQLEKFGTVIGDRSAGAVMESRHHSLQMGTDTVLLYGVSITSADLIMSDGKSLERNGVTPDEVLLPTAADLAAGRDPVLSRAAALLGIKLEPEKAGGMFPIEWQK